MHTDHIQSPLPDDVGGNINLEGLIPDHTKGNDNTGVGNTTEGAINMVARVY